MSDDEQSPPQSPAPAASPQHTSAPIPNEGGKSEAQIRMEQEAKRRKERAEEEWREYEEFRREEREKAEEEIRQLKERRERRKEERAEEEKRLAELRQVEEQKRRAEEEERQRKKREEEQRKREEREKKRQEWEQRRNANRPNFVITKKEGGEAAEQPEAAEEKKEEVTKSKEQLEAERKSIIEQRVPPLNITGFTLEQLKAKAKELHELLCRVEGENYDLSQRFKRQSYDMQELAERARQMSKGGKSRAVSAENDPRAAKYSGIPPMVIMYSQYERVKDPRSFGDRRTVFSGENYAEEYQRILPKKKLVMTEEGFQVDEAIPEEPKAEAEATQPPAEVAAQ
ncbi:unnamed protein product [Calicophoron daubneyi]|uniref:Troponin T n=1 Tax=Calicophoron daubneyi TaxID=300641 RepID=A0AAV2T989_CALDB